jgi:hypothetical protein
MVMSLSQASREEECSLPGTRDEGHSQQHLRHHRYQEQIMQLAQKLAGIHLAKRPDAPRDG